MGATEVLVVGAGPAGDAPVLIHTVHAGNRRLHEIYGADMPSLFLVRPDGHVAYRGPAWDLEGLESYLDRLFMGRERRIEYNVGGRGAQRSVGA